MSAQVKIVNFFYYDQYEKIWGKNQSFFPRASFPWKWRPSLFLGDSHNFKIASSNAVKSCTHIEYIECTIMISPKIAILGFFIKWMCCSIILLEDNPTMSNLLHNSLESHSKNHQCKHVWSTNMICPEITMVVRTYQVCALKE